MAVTAIGVVETTAVIVASVGGGVTALSGLLGFGVFASLDHKKIDEPGYQPYYTQI